MTPIEDPAVTRHLSALFTRAMESARLPDDLRDSIRRILRDEPLARFVREQVRRHADGHPADCLWDWSQRRWLRDQVVAAAKDDRLLAEPADELFLYLSLVNEVRVLRRESGQRVTRNRAAAVTVFRDAEKLLTVLDAEDRVLASYKSEDRTVAAVADWYRLAEDAALPAEEIARLANQPVEAVRLALQKARVELALELSA